MTLVEEEYGEVCYEQEIPCLILRWKGFTNSAEFRDLLEKGLDAYKEKSRQHPKLGWISDTRKLSAVPESDYVWFKQQWEPRLYEAGVRCVAMVKPDNIFGEIAMHRYSRQLVTDRSVLIHPKLFNTLQDAKDWIGQQCQTPETGCK